MYILYTGYIIVYTSICTMITIPHTRYILHSVLSKPSGELALSTSHTSPLNVGPTILTSQCWPNYTPLNVGPTTLTSQCCQCTLYIQTMHIMYIYRCTCGIALCLECRVSWVRVPPKATHFLRKSDCLGCAVLPCLVVCLTLLLASYFQIHVYNNVHVYVYTWKYMCIAH